MKDGLYRVWAYVRHWLTAWNTTGEGIHSPHLFAIVRLVMRDENSYYCFADVERRRAALLTDSQELEVKDFGSAGSPEGTMVRRRVCTIARTHLERPEIGQLLFRLVVFLGRELKRPLNILELGTSLGITTAYLAAADSRNRVTTLEGSGAVLGVAKEQWRALRLNNISYVEGPIDDTLYSCAREDQRFDFVYADANHTYEATMRYADWLLNHLTEKGILVLDDIHYSHEMERAWVELKNDARVTTSMDLYHIGLLYVDRHYLKRHYRIRI